MQSALVIFLVALGAVAKMGALGHCISCRLVRRLPLFCGMVTLALARSIVGLNPHLHPYLEFWTATHWPMAVLEAGAVLEAFWRVAGHFRKMRRFGMILLAVIVCVAATVAFGVGIVRAHWNGPLSGALLFDQYTQLGLLVITLLSVGFFWLFPGVPIRPNASLHLLALAILFGSNFVGTFLAHASHGEWRFVSNMVLAVGIIVAYGWWAARTTMAGELLPFPEAPPLSMTDFARAERRDELDAREISRVGAKALRKVFRQ